MSAQPTPDVILAAQTAYEKWGIPASISLAQWALESGWGKHMPPDSCNPFGVKAGVGQPFVTCRTREVDPTGKEYFIDAKFRKFASLAEAFDLHAKLLATSPNYTHARKLLPSAIAFADALTGVYATDPAYGAELRAIMRGSNLYRFDEPPQGAAA